MIADLDTTIPHAWLFRWPGDKAWSKSFESPVAGGFSDFEHVPLFADANPMPNAQPVASLSSVSTDAVGVDVGDLDRMFANIPEGPYSADARGEGWEVRAIDADPTNPHHWPSRLCASIAGQKAGCDPDVFGFIAGVINAWPTISAALRSAPPQQEAGPVAVKALTVAEVEAIIISTEDVRSDQVWTRRMAVALADTFNRRLHPSPATLADETLRAENERLRGRIKHLEGEIANLQASVFNSVTAHAKALAQPSPEGRQAEEFERKDRLPDGHTILEQADRPDGLVGQTVRIDATGREYERVVHEDEAYGPEDDAALSPEFTK